MQHLHRERTEHLPAYILAGGRSSRFGSDKARALLQGRPLIVHVAEMLAPVATRTTVVAGTGTTYDDLGLTSIHDRRPGLGPMGGIEAALSDLCSHEDWLLLASCDLVQVRPHWIERLRAHREPGARAVAFRPDQWQPLLALYHRSIQESVNQRLNDGRTAMWQLLDAVRAVAAPVPADWPDVVQVNTPRDLERFLAGKPRKD